MSHTGAPPSSGGDRAADFRRRDRWQTKAGIILAAGVAVILAFWLGRATTPQPGQGGQTAGCAAIVQSSTDMMKQAQTPSTDSAATVRTAMNLVLQNPTCFTPDIRARAQTILDQGDQAAARQAVCDASGQPWWKC